ncbi:MAG: ketoacyl-ACP synthase III [Salinibacterium sp.]|nr:ketoacyl-ACP synthase III [Salinibacterium sp.]
MKSLRDVGIAGTGHYVPERVLSNHDLEKLVDTTDEWIFTRTGMRERRIAADDQACSDLCFQAASQALDDAGMKADELQLIIVATVTPDQLLPATAAFLQDKLGAWNAGGWDITNACTGFLSAMTTAYGMIASGQIDNALIVGAEVLSRILNYQDRASCILFGDGAGAMVLKADHPQGKIIFNTTGMDGSQWEAIQRSAGGSKRPINHEIVERREHLMTLKGNEVFKFAVSKFRGLVEQSLEATGHTPADLDLVVPHQVNIRIIESALKKIDIDMDRVYINLDRFGNTSAASVPIAFDEARRAGRVKQGDLISFVAFGAGLAWGSALIRW